MIDVTLNVNGAEESVQADGATTLLRVLREQLRLNGAKRGCDYGVCGACSVLIDGEPARACLTLAADCEGRAILTIEGVAPSGELSALQQALLDVGAVQCGFCTPAVVLALKALLDKPGKPDEAAVRAALGGNICRCTGYAAIVDAALKVAHG